MSLQYDPTGKKYVLTTLKVGNDTYELKLWASTVLSFLHVGIYLNTIRIVSADMNCQAGLITSELWDSFTRRFMDGLEAVVVEGDVVGVTLMEHIWAIMAQIKLTIVDGHLSADIPEYFER